MERLKNHDAAMTIHPPKLVVPGGGRSVSFTHLMRAAGAGW